MEEQIENQQEEIGSADSKKASTLRNLVPFFIVIVVALVGAALYFFVYTGDSVNEEQRTEQPDSFNPLGEPNYIIEEVPIGIEEIAPDPNRTIQFSESVPEEVRAMLVEQAAPIRARISEDVTRADDWFNLGIIYHTANDYRGAEEVWLFLIQVIPNSVTAYDNLAKLYHFSLRDFVKAESYFKQSLAVGPNSLAAYLGLHELYRYSYKQETTLAVDIIRDAMGVFPEELGLYVTLGGYYKDAGNVNAARAVLLEGLDKARDLNNVDMIQALGQEIERLQ